MYYHSQCLSMYCAIKRSTSEPPKTSTTTRSSHSLSSTDKRGVLNDECIFCGKQRKKRKSEEEPLHQCLTDIASKSIWLAAVKKEDTKIISLGEDLIAKELKYHGTCKKNYIDEAAALTVSNEGYELNTENVQGVKKFVNRNQTSKKKFHLQAFDKVSYYITQNVMQLGTPFMGSFLLKLYQDSYVSAGGQFEDIQDYNFKIFS